jgi:pyridoxamine 5'-phosphate oxidase family protein
MVPRSRAPANSARRCRILVRAGDGGGPDSRPTAHRPGSRGMPQQPHRLAGHERHRHEFHYLTSQRLGRIATVGPDGQPHVVPASFRCNAGHDAIDVGGLRMNQTTKLRDAQRTAPASIVIDDVLPPWQPRMIKCAGPRPSSRRAAKPSVSDSRTPSSASSSPASSHSASTPARRPARDRSARRDRQQDRARRTAPHSHAATFKDG